MAAKPLTSEAIANTEKKMDMTLDDIIKMSKNSTSQAKKQRVLNKNQKFLNGGTAQGNSSKLRRFMDSRSSLRQGILVQRRSSFQGNSFPVATEVSRKAAAAPVRNRTLNRDRVVNWNKPRVGAHLDQREAANGRIAQKQLQKHRQAMLVPKMRPQTLDSLFANMKEQRMIMLSQQKKQNSTARWGGGAQQRGRGRFGNLRN